jgi:glutaredoxin
MAMSTVQFYTREGCHLCDEALAIVERVRAGVPFHLEVIDVDSAPALAERYGLEVPVVLVDGRKHAKYHVDEAALRRRLAVPGAATDAPIDASTDERPA